MPESKQRVLGFTLAELLVVIAILAMLTAAAVPAITRVGGFLSNDPDLAARELYSSLRAARVYATTYNVDTAVVYGLRDRTDSNTQAAVPIIDAYGIARKLTAHEFALLRQLHPEYGLTGTDVGISYTMIQDWQGQFRRMPEKACIISINNAYNPPLGVAGDGSQPAEGLVPVLLFDANGLSIAPLMPLSGTPGDMRLPAHVFKSTGFMEPVDSPVARFTINVAAAPDAPLQDRFSDEASNELKVPARIELFQATGRVKMTS